MRYKLRKTFWSSSVGDDSDVVVSATEVKSQQYVRKIAMFRSWVRSR